MKLEFEFGNTLLPSVKVRPEGNTKPLQSRFISECQNIMKIFEENNENEENSRETAKDPDFDEYHDIEGKNKDEEKTRKIKQNSIRKQARTQASSLIGPRNLPNPMRLEQRSSAELGRNSSEAVLGIGQNTFSYETGRMVSGSVKAIVTR